MRAINKNSIIALPVYLNDNFSKREQRTNDLIVRISCHQHHIEKMLQYASTVKCSRERTWIATEIGYIHIEVHCILMPELERLQIEQ